MHFFFKVGFRGGVLAADPDPHFFVDLKKSPNLDPCQDISINPKRTRWAREPKSKTARSTPFFKNIVVWAAVLCTKST
jgi:hypothetical protein